MQVTLKVLVGKSAGREVSVSSFPFIIGRSEECQLRPKTDTVSRRHCELSLRDGQIFVRDLGSKNGTLLNGERIEDECGVTSGDQIKVGKLAVEVVVNSPISETSTDLEQTKAVAKVESAREETVVDKPSAKEGSKAGKEPPAQKQPAVKKAASSKLSRGAIIEDIDDDISGWLEEADHAEKSRRLADPETRQFRLDETEQVALKEAEKKAEEEAKTQAEAEQETESETKEKKKPGKLPPRPAQTTENSRQAAEDMLKRFFSRR